MSFFPNSLNSLISIYFEFKVCERLNSCSHKNIISIATVQSETAAVLHCSTFFRIYSLYLANQKLELSIRIGYKKLTTFLSYIVTIDRHYI